MYDIILYNIHTLYSYEGTKSKIHEKKTPNNTKKETKKANKSKYSYIKRKETRINEFKTRKRKEENIHENYCIIPIVIFLIYLSLCVDQYEKKGEKND